MERIEKTYTVWKWNVSKEYRIGKIFNTKIAADLYVSAIPPRRYIGTIVRMQIFDDDAA